jgi:hypothetical protein
MRWIRINETEIINLEKIYKMMSKKYADGTCALFFYSENLILMGTMHFKDEQEFNEKMKRIFGG